MALHLCYWFLSKNKNNKSSADYMLSSPHVMLIKTAFDFFSASSPWEGGLFSLWGVHGKLDVRVRGLTRPRCSPQAPPSGEPSRWPALLSCGSSCLGSRTLDNGFGVCSLRRCRRLIKFGDLPGTYACCPYTKPAYWSYSSPFESLGTEPQFPNLHKGNK